MIDNDDALKRLFESDQSITGLDDGAKTIAHAVLAYYRELVAGGLSEEQAFTLVTTTSEMLWGRSLWPGDE